MTQYARLTAKKSYLYWKLNIALRNRPYGKSSTFDSLVSEIFDGKQQPCTPYQYEPWYGISIACLLDAAHWEEWQAYRRELWDQLWTPAELLAAVLDEEAA